MSSIRARTDNGKLFLDFRYKGKRCREQTLLDDSPANRKKLQLLLDKVEAEITLGSFEYARYFPDSPKATELQTKPIMGGTDSISFKDFSDIWMSEMKPQWRKTHAIGIQGDLNKHVLPWFGKKGICYITKADILSFRASISSVTKKNGQSLTASRINHIMTPLRMILNEAANRYAFSSPYNGIKSLKVPKTDVEPFTLEEVKLIIDPAFKSQVQFL